MLDGDRNRESRLSHITDSHLINYFLYFFFNSFFRILQFLGLVSMLAWDAAKAHFLSPSVTKSTH